MPWFDDLIRDLRVACRALRRAPVFTLVAISSLGLATGAATAIFSIVYGVLLRPLPFAAPERLVQLYGPNWRDASANSAPDTMTGPLGSLELEAFARDSRALERFAGYEVTTAHLDSPSGVERLTAVVADRSFFRLLGVEPIAGRTFRADDAPDVAVIGADLWRRRFGGDPALPGRAIVLDGKAVTVLGVMPDAFQFPYGAASLLPGALPEGRTDVWRPLPPLRDAATGGLRRGRVTVTGRLAPGVTIAAASAELNAIAARLEAGQRAASGQRPLRVRLGPLADLVSAPVRRPLWMLFAAVGLVLAAACANMANLLLARMTLRTREVVTRAALGAGRARLVRQFLAESLLLSLAGGLVGLLIARVGTRLLVVLAAATMPRAHEVAIDWRVFAFLLLVCLSTAVLFGLAPAITAARVDVGAAIKDGGHATMGRRFARMRDVLVILEVALAFVLACGAALVMREVGRLRQVPTGMVTANVLTLHLTPRAPARDYYAIEQRVAQLPGVLGAGFTQLVPLQNWGWDATFAIRRDPSPPQQPRRAGLRYVTPGYFATIGVPILRGRGFTAHDVEGAPAVVIVNDTLARRYFAGEDPVGRELDRGLIVGVAGDVRQVGLNQPPEPELYYPAAQNVTMASDIGMSLIVRTAGPPEPLTDTLRAAVRAVTPSLAIFRVKTMEQVLADSLWELNLYRWLIGLFASLALTLATMGLYGVMSYNVTSRLREFAVRLSLGSAPSQLARLVLLRGARLAGVGLAVGLAAALAAMPALRHLSTGSNGAGLDGAGPSGTGLNGTGLDGIGLAGAGLGGDAATYAGIAALLLVIALLACAIPAWRVAGVNPASALRQD